MPYPKQSPLLSSLLPQNPANKSTPLQSDVCLYFLAIFLPPLAVFFKRGCNADFLINILLSILGWIPGVLRKFPLPSSLLTLSLSPFPSIAPIPLPIRNQS